jgi:hypothetical protein
MDSKSFFRWAFAKRALARGDDPEEVIRRIADYRATDKHDPFYYARLTVQKARIELDQQHTFSQPDSAQSNSPKAPEHTP